MILAAVGAICAETWTDPEALATHPDFRQLLQQPGASWTFYHGMIAPLLPCAIRGVIWYQGESNASHASTYRTLFPLLIESWRKGWQRSDLPFVFVQLPGWRPSSHGHPEGSFVELRAAQFMTWRQVARTAMAVTIDVGDATDVHPRRKEPVGARLALAARKLAYGENIIDSGPIYDSMSVAGNRVILRFRSMGSGLVARGGPLRGFTITGQDRQFVEAEAEILGDTVVVHSARVSRPVAVRYGWEDCPEVNLWNQEGLPAAPFRTDAFPLSTQPSANHSKGAEMVSP